MRTALFLALLCGCAANTDFNPDVSPGLESELAAGKTDGAFGSREISIGDTVTGETSGDGLVLFSIQLQSDDELAVSVTRTSGDLKPGAYLYQGINNFVRPDSFDVSADSVDLFFTAPATGEHFIIVRAHRGEGSGEFSLTVECTDGPCATGSSLTGLARADQCLTRAADCVITELPRYNGAVGPSRSQTLLDECLAATGADCVDACDAAPELAHTCDVIKGSLPTFADLSLECLVEMTECLDQCGEFSGLGFGDDNEFLQTPTCWDGHQGSSSSATGHCSDYVFGLDVCGGDSYDAGTVEACHALCESTEGAWDEGPFDGCFDECDNP